jgi:site-specific DNA-cytosine methylase
MSSFSDLVKEVNEEKKKKREAGITEEKQETAFGSLVKQANSEISKSTTKMSSTDVGNWFTSVSDVVNRASSHLSTDGYRAKDTSLTEEIEKYLSEATDVSHFLRVNKSYLKDFDSTYNSYVSAVSTLTNLRNSVQSSNRYFSQFENAEDYDTQRSGWLNPEAETNSETVALRKDKYQSNKSRIAEIESELKTMGFSSWVEYGTEKGKKRKALNEEKEALEAENRRYENSQKTLDDNYVPITDDVKRIASANNYTNASKEELWNYDMSMIEGSTALSNGGYVDEEGNIRDYKGNIVQYGNAPEVQDKLGMFLAAVKDGTMSNYVAELSATNGNYTNTWANLMQEGDVNGWRFLEEDEITIYYYKYYTEGQASAYKFLEDMTTELTRRETQKRADDIADASFLEQIALNAASIPMNVFGGAIGFVDDISNLVQGKDTNPYSRAHMLSNDASAIRQDIAMDIDKLTGGASIPLLDFSVGDAYQAVMSGADSLVGSLLGGTAYGVLMGMGAASAEMKELYEKGASTEQMFFGGILAGAAEMVFEKYSIDKFVKMGDTKSKRDVIINILKQGGVEASEEALTEIANTITNAIVMGSQSDWVDVGTFVKNVVNAGLGGFISGGGMGGVGSIANYAQYAQQRNEHGQTIIDRVGGVDSLQALAMDMAGVNQNKEGQEIANLAGKVAKKASAKNVGNLSVYMRDTITEQNKADIQQALAKKGLSEEESSRVADYLYKASTGYEFSKTEAAEVEGNDKIMEVLRDVVGDPNSTINERTRNLITARLGIYTPKNTKANAVTENPTSNENATEPKFEVSESGKTTYNGNEVKIKDVASIKDGEVMLLLDNGETVNARDVEFGSEEEGLIYEAVVDMDIDRARDFVQGFNAYRNAPLATPQTASDYRLGFNESYTYGRLGITEEVLERDGQFSKSLNSGQKKIAYNRGRIDAESSVKADQAKLDEAMSNAKPKKSKANGRVIYDKGIRGTLSDEGIRAESLKLLEFFNVHFSHAKVRIFASYTDEVGRRVFKDADGKVKLAPNGMYLPDGSMAIDLNAGQMGQGQILYTFSHELTHMAKRLSPEKYKAYADFLLKHYGENHSIEALIAEERDNARKKGRYLSLEDAYDEAVARLSERMLVDVLNGTAQSKLTELNTKHKDIFEKIKEFFAKLVERIKSLYKDMPSDSASANIVHEMQDIAEQLQTMWLDMVVDAGKVNSTLGGDVASSLILAEAGIGFDSETHSVYSLRYSTARKDADGNVIDLVTVGKKEFNTESIAQLVAKVTGRSIVDARKWVNSEATIANMVMKNPEFLDFEADNRYEAIKKNSDYPQGTVDLSNLCPKRTEFTSMFDMLQKKYPNRLFTASDVAAMRNILKGADITVACGACFVEDRRQLLGEIADTYIGMWKEAVETGKPLQKTNAAGNKIALKVTAALAKQYGLTKGADIIATDTYIPTQYDLTTYEGFKLLEKNHPIIAMGFNRYNNSRGQQAGRLIEGRAEYNRQILGWTDAKVRSVNNNGGLRIFSFSDFEVVHLLDLVQVIIDCSARGVKIQGYTKIPAFAKLVRNTGIKLNRSLIPKGQTGIKVVNGKQVLDIDLVEGIDITDENFLDESDNPDVGNIIIGINPTQIGIAMLDDFIDYIIPFHTNKSKDICKELGVGEWVNYKESQHDKDIATGKASKHNVNIYTQVINKYHPTNKVEFVDAFLKECKAQKKIPRYAEFLNKEYKENGAYHDEYGAFDYTYREGYHKFLVDFKMFDKQGNILPQGNIVPQLNDKFMSELLKAEVDKKQNYKFPQEVYDRLDKEFGVDGTKRSDRVSTESLLEEREYTVSEIKDLFNRWNTDKELSALAEKVFTKLENLILEQKEQGDRERHYLFQYATRPYTIRVTNADYIRKRAWVNRGVGVFSDDRGSGLYGITFDSEGLASLDNDQTRAQVLLHEAIHAITVRAIDNVKKEIPKDTGLYTDFVAPSNWSEEQKGALALLQIFQQVGFSGYFEKKVHYGEETVYEMVAELSNPEFRQFLKKKSLWSRVVDAIKRILGIWTDNAFDATSSALERILNEGVTTSDSDILYSDRVLMGSLFSGGGTLEAGLAYQMLDKQFGVEYDGKIASVYADNHGDHIQVGRVEDFDISQYDDIFYLHASPVCHNFSKAKHGAKELQMDIDSAKATAKHLETAMPQVFTVENAPGYRKSQSLKIITDKLTELGYKWDVDVYNSADYGSATSRNRVILRAVKDGELPAKPTKQDRTNSWDKVTRDLWDTLPKSYLRPSFISAIENTPKLPILDANGKVNVNKPLLILTTTSGHMVTYCWEGEICPTLTTKCGEAKLVMPDGNIYAVTPEFMGRIQGLPDDYKYPKAKTRAFTIIGNGIPTHLTKAVVGGVLDSAYEQTHNGKVLYSDRNSNAPTFYSYMGRVVDGIKNEKIGANGVVPYLKGKGVKDEEIKWSGIEAFLEGKKSVTKAELQEFIAGSQLVIEEKMGEGGASITLERSRYGDDSWNVMRGGEILDTYSWNEDSELYESDETGGGFSTKDRVLEYFKEKYGSGDTRWEKYKLDGGTNYRELVFKMPSSTYSNNAMKVHWGIDAKGVLAHARIQDMTTADGNKMLFVEEIQSDWHNAGQKYGYEGEDTEASLAAKDYKTIESMIRLLRIKGFMEGDEVKVAEELAALNVYARALKTFDVSVERTHFGGDPSEPLVYVMWWDGDANTVEEDATDFKESIESDLLHIRDNDLSGFAHAEIAPDAPFRNNYHEYVLKRLLRMAAEEDYDSLGWTPAHIQADRWSYDYIEAYKIEYDQDIPKFLRKYGKKWGATVGKTELPSLNTTYTYYDVNREETYSLLEWREEVESNLKAQGAPMRNVMYKTEGEYYIVYDKVSGMEYDRAEIRKTSDSVWSMSITDSMKDSVLNEGQVMYSDRNTEFPDADIKYSLRTEAPPKKTVEVYKLMRLKDGKIYPLFIDSTEPLEVGTWYDADSPNLDFLKKLPSGIFLIDTENESYTTFADYLAKSGEKKTKYPSKRAIEEAATNGLRWVYIEDTAKGQKRFGGETRKYWNLGINGSGAVSTFSMRPGYHAGSLPTMRQIGKGANKDLRDDSFVWTIGEVPADINYQAEADRNPDKDIPTHIPVNGYYLKATNADKAKSQADVMGWYVAGSYKINRVISDSEARQIIDDWNAEHPNAKALYDYDRESGMDFDADLMKLVPRENTKYSEREIQPITDAEYDTLKKHFGVTGNFRVAGYLLPDGSLLDFSGKHWGDTTSRMRQVDHRDVGEVLNRGNNGINDMIDMIGSGSIRLMPETGGINLAVYPNEKQRRVLSVYINYMLNTEEQIIIDYDAVGGDTVYSKEYGKTATSRQILNDIRNYFNGARQSDLMKFHTMYSDRDHDSVSNRSLLAHALESVAQNDIERNKLNEYKSKIALIESEQKKLAEVTDKANEIRFTKGRTAEETKKMKSLEFEAKQIANRINTYDRQLLNLEATSALKAVLEREKKKAYKRAEQKGREALARQREKDAETQRELMNRYQASRKKGIESRKKTELRHKIKDVVNELYQYLEKGTKDKHVPIYLQKPVAEALDAVNMDTVGAEERIAKKREEMRVAASKGNVDKVNDLAKEIEHIQEMGGNMEAKLSRLKTAYDSIINSDDPLVANSYDEVISNTIAKVIEVVGETPLRDMSLYQLEAVYDMYRMVLTSVRNANKTFKAEKGKEISVLANTVIADLDGKKRNPFNVADTNFAWNNLKPVYAFERIGSNTFTKLFNAVRAGEDVWARDMSEAQAFREEQSKKHKFDSWDFKKKYTFTTERGKVFELDLGEIMSIYAFAKDEHSKGHLTGEGFVFDPKKEVVKKVKGNIEVKVNLEDATSYNLTEQIVADIISKLTPDQKAFADAMQDYLSTTMGEKGNEVSLELYEIKLFKNKNYFPLKVAPQYMAVAKEKAQGDVKIKNKGFTKDRKEGAQNPIVLSSFMDVWANHVNEMSMYHAFTLPLEDFYRVFNYKTPRMEGYAPMSVNASIQNAFGEAATSYIDQLLKDLNGGARSDPRETLGKTMMSNFKKASVMASLSVVIQQPSAIIRAQALVDAKYFVGKPTMTRHSETWAEVKKYAPVAVIKEMGYFDTGMGKGSVEWLKGEKTFMDKVDDVVSKAPALADELTWCAIWNAVKRETLHTHKDLKPNSDEFLKAVGERFTEVIVKTQVYDSTLARSANMRSKGALMNMWTAFMAEPTTSINMLQDAFTKGKRGKYTARVLGAVYGSVILNSALVSLIYAMRDDDEDETFIEKYLSRFVTEVVDGVNPLTYIPFVKDIWSALQGFDIERADMSLITKVIDSMQQLINVARKDTSDMDEDELAEHKKAVTEAILGIADNLASLVGVPVKNIRRDINGIINGFNTIKEDMNGRETTAGSLGDNLLEDVKDSVPVWGWFPDESKGDKLYDAIIKGDTAYVDRLKKGYKSESAYNTALRKALRENDPRIQEAAKARYNGDIAEYMRIAKAIIAEGNFKQDDVVAAINSEISNMEKGEGTTASSSNKVKSMFEMGDYYAALLDRDEATAYAVREDLIKTDIANGKDREEAEENFNSRFVNHCREQFEEGYLSEYEAKNMLVKYGNKSEEDADSKVQYWAFKQEYPDYEMSEEAVKKYYNDVEPHGINVSAYYDYVKGRAKCKGTDSDGDGRTDSGSVKSEVMRVINSLPITSAQKDVLYYLNGWSANTIWEAPWH